MIRKTVAALGVLLAILLAPARLNAQIAPAAALERLPGCWEARRGDRRVVERWERTATGGYTGESRSWAGDRPTGSESIVLRPDAAGVWIYAVDPDTQRPASFKGVLVTDTLLVFENPQHDFPQRIVYRPAGADSLHAWIEGITPGAGPRVDFPFGRVRCEGRR